MVAAEVEPLMPAAIPHALVKVVALVVALQVTKMEMAAHP